jgi:hypothetical protein
MTTNLFTGISSEQQMTPRRDQNVDTVDSDEDLGAMVQIDIEDSRVNRNEGKTTFEC